MLEEADNYVQSLNDKFTNPSGEDMEAAQRHTTKPEAPRSPEPPKSEPEAPKTPEPPKAEPKPAETQAAGPGEESERSESPQR